MTPATLVPDPTLAEPPDHLGLPCKDGAIVNSMQEHPQSDMLTDCLSPLLRKLVPNGQFCIGCDSGIYWKWTNPPLKGCKAPDWFLVLNVPPLLDGQIRRSFVLWREGGRPLVVIEYISGDGSEEHDRTPETGKFWVYEQAVCAPYYVIFDPWKETLEVYQLVAGQYQQATANAAGRYAIPQLGIEMGVWHGTFRELTGAWLRPWDAATGEMLPVSVERAEAAEQRADSAELALDETRTLLTEEIERGKRLAEKLRALGIDPDAG